MQPTPTGEPGRRRLRTPSTPALLYLPLFIRTDLDANMGTWCGPSRSQYFVAGHHHFDGPPSLLSQEQRKRLQIDRGLAAKTTTDFRWHNFNVIHDVSCRICPVNSRIAKAPWVLTQIVP